MFHKSLYLTLYTLVYIWRVDQFRGINWPDPGVLLNRNPGTQSAGRLGTYLVQFCRQTKPLFCTLLPADSGISQNKISKVKILYSSCSFIKPSDFWSVTRLVWLWLGKWRDKLEWRGSKKRLFVSVSNKIIILYMLFSNDSWCIIPMLVNIQILHNPFLWAFRIRSSPPVVRHPNIKMTSNSHENDIRGRQPIERQPHKKTEWQNKVKIMSE